MADLYLPIAQAAFGRTSKSRPHRLHHAHRATYEAFADPDAGDVLLELRAEGKAKRRRPKKPAAAPQDSGAERSDPPKAGAHQPRPLHSSCPVVALGMSGSSRRYLDAKGQLIELPVSRRVKAEIQGLFCDQAGLALEYWTRINDRTGRPDGWHPDGATLDLLTANGAHKTLRENNVIQSDVAQCEAKLRSARLHPHDVAGDVARGRGEG